jgi:hypothetical protein
VHIPVENELYEFVQMQIEMVKLKIGEMCHDLNEHFLVVNMEKGVTASPQNRLTPTSPWSTLNAINK